jgi:hypothetical protein
MVENYLHSAELNLPGAPEKSDDFREIYANNIRLSITPVDLIIYFGHITETKTGGAVIKEDIGVRMSPQSLKSLVVNLTNAMVVWETQFGPIQVTAKTPQEVLNALREASQKR